jgi:hypothetical protein
MTEWSDYCGAATEMDQDGAIFPWDFALSF